MTLMRTMSTALSLTTVSCCGVLQHQEEAS